MVFAIAAVIGIVGVAVFYAMASLPKTVPPAPSSHLDRIVVIVLENYRSDKVDPAAIGSEQLTPFLNRLSKGNRIELNYFGVWKSSLSNYIAMIGGNFFGVRNDDDSCFNPDHKKPCHSLDAPNLVDQLEEAQIAWEGLFESMPGVGFLGATFPTDSKLYAQKHNPFVYFKSIALDPTRLAKLKPFVLNELKVELEDSVTASRFIYIVPNQCHDQHGTVGCERDAVRLAAGDDFLAETVPAIIDAPAFTDRSVLFITWDNSKGREACCGAWRGGGRIRLIAVTKHPMAIGGTTPSDHYSLLATIEDGFGLPRLANAKGAATLFDLLPDFAEKRAVQTSDEDGRSSLSR
jgi:phosphatidylinositol-3-phosphatase